MMKHVHITQRDELVCDFCSKPGVCFRYPCETTIAMAAVDAHGGARSVAASDDDWAACGACAIVVAERNPMKLAHHVVDNWEPDPATGVLLRSIPAIRQTLVANLMELYCRLLPVLGERVADGGRPTGDAGKTIKVVGDGDE